MNFPRKPKIDYYEVEKAAHSLALKCQHIITDLVAERTFTWDAQEPVDNSVRRHLKSAQTILESMTYLIGVTDTFELGEDGYPIGKQTCPDCGQLEYLGPDCSNNYAIAGRAYQSYKHLCNDCARRQTRRIQRLEAQDPATNHD